MKKILFFATIFSQLSLHAQDPVTTTKMEVFGDHIFIHLSVDGSEPLNFLFDTGDGLPVIDLDIAKQLKLALDHQSSKTSAQGTIEGSLINHNYIELNGIKLEKDIQLYATSLNHLEMSIGRNVDGIIGYDLLHHYVVRLDYDKEEFLLYNPKNYTYDGNGESFEFRLDNYIPHITCEVKLNNGEKLSGDFFLNTGAGTTVDFNTPFAKKHDIINKTGEHFSYPVAGLSDKETLHYEGRVANFSFGSFRFDNHPIGISQATKGVQSNKKMAGIIGSRLLNHFNITFDYSKKKIFFEKNKNFEKNFSVNASGIYLQLSEDQQKVLVHKVYDNSPAQKAGLMQDAELVKVNGKDVGSFSLPELRALLLKIDTKVELVVKQEGKEKTVKLDLKQMI